MPIRTSEATWRNGVRDGDGEVALGSGSWRGEYTFRSRFTEDEPAKTNPEELVAAGHAGCFSLALANNLESEGYVPERVHTTAHCHLEMRADEGPTITELELETEVAVPDIEDTEFQNIAEDAKNNCPVSRALAGVDITLDASFDT